MKALRRFWGGRVAPFLASVLAALDAFREEAAFRTWLAWSVIVGRVPVERERRWWNRAVEVPVLVDARDWTDERLLFSVLVWPVLEENGRWAELGHRERVNEVKGIVVRGAADRAWSMSFETDRGMSWDPDREVWVGSDGYAFDGERLRAYSRKGS